MASKRWLIVLAVVSLVIFQAVPAAASAPYESYNFNYYEETVPSPAAYLPDKSISGSDLGIGDFMEPSDMVVSANGWLYVLDSGNNRVVSVDKNWKVVKVISTFDNNGSSDQFKNPSGIFVNEEGDIYVADTDNGRVVVLTEEGEMIRMIKDPKSEVLPENFKFVPLKITVDKADRIYVVARGIYEGIMQFDKTGEFIGYVGTNKVKRSYVDYFWRLISTAAQKAQMVLFIPTEFSNLDIDHKGFVFATNIDPASKEPIKRLNPSGEDVLKRFGYFDVVGDMEYVIYGANKGPSKMIDIKVREGGMYSALDSMRGRIFTYDDEGNILYIFGWKGTQLGTFKTPVAVESMGDKMLVLDRGKSNIVIFEPTAFGKAVNQAVKLSYDGETTQAVSYWEEVLRLNSNYDIAYIGIGKSLLNEKKNEEALGYFKLGMERKQYSVAYKRYRKESMKEYFGVFLTVILVLVLALVTFKLLKRWRQRRLEHSEARFH